MAKAKKRLFVVKADITSDCRDFAWIVGIGETVCEIQIVREFKAKFDGDANLILPKEKK